MNKYIIFVDEHNNIIRAANTFDYSKDDIEITREEFENVLLYKKYNPITKEFLEPVKDAKECTLEDKKSISIDNINDKLNKVMEHLGLNQ